jgi:hypothetical protein
MENHNTIECHNCGTKINVADVLSAKLTNELQTKFNMKESQIKQDYERKVSELNEGRRNFEIEKRQFDELVENGIANRIASEKSAIEKVIRAQIEDEKSLQINAYKNQLDLKTEELKNLFKLKAENEMLMREKTEWKEKMEMEIEMTVNKVLGDERNKIKAEHDNITQLKVAEKEMVINQLKEQLTIAQRKADSGSGQLKGEVQELALEQFLRKTFPNDLILEIKKGVNGADLIHKVSLGTEISGSIVYESKRCAQFSKSWIDKIKKDCRKVTDAYYSVIVTDTFPKGTEPTPTKIDGVLICSFEQFKSLSVILRDCVARLNEAAIVQVDKNGKMNNLYRYLVGNEFKSHINAIVEEFIEMHHDLAKEKRAMDGIWKKREKQIHSVLSNISEMHGSIRGIAGSSVSPIQSLELGEGE